MNFSSVLIANRGEIALRVLRACRDLGLRTIAVHSEADAGQLHVELADQALCIGPAAAGQSYLDIGRILLAARATGAGAIHPGYGFLSENAAFARAVEDAGLVFIGPDAGAIATMGDKVAARKAMEAAGIPCVPGTADALPTDIQAATALADGLGYPLIIKAAAGGGGRGMCVVERREDFAAALHRTREEVGRVFGNPAVYAERYLDRPRHIEIQVLADMHGNAVWLGERDCSMQRRHQKVVEEAPAPGIERDEIAGIGALCAKACKAIGYVGAGTFEFLWQDGAFYFIEMNTRIQVEHTVTEEVTGFDLVREQIRIAGGHPLSFAQSDIRTSGHAIELRINAEDPLTFQPRPGRVERYRAPGGPGIRVDTLLIDGLVIPPHYDSLVAKIIAHGRTREEAIWRLEGALSEFRADGLVTNIPLLRELLGDIGFERGGSDIHYLERLIAGGRLQLERK